MSALHDRPAADAKVRLVVAYGRARTEAEELKADKNTQKRSKRNRAFLRPVVRPGFADAFSIPKEARRAARDNGYKKQPTFRVCCRHERKTPPLLRACFGRCVPPVGRRRRPPGLCVEREWGVGGDTHAAVYDNGGTLMEEPFGAYGLGDVDTALATLAAADGGTEGTRFPGRDDAQFEGATFVSNRAFLSPFFIASDPNLLWPTLYYYGSLANALSRVGVDPSKTPPPPPTLLAPSVKDGDASILACGHDACRKVAARTAMMRCSRCKGRASARPCVLPESRLENPPKRARRRRARSLLGEVGPPRPHDGALPLVRPVGQRRPVRQVPPARLLRTRRVGPRSRSRPRRRAPPPTGVSSHSRCVRRASPLAVVAAAGGAAAATRPRPASSGASRRATARRRGAAAATGGARATRARATASLAETAAATRASWASAAASVAPG